MANLLVLSGLIIPPAIVPTIWVLQNLGLFKTLPGLILVEIAFGMSFSVLLFRAFVAAIPRELDEAAIIDGASAFTLFFRVIFPLLRPVTITVILTQSVFIFNDFVNPLYFLPGDENATVQLTLFNFQSQFSTQYNLLFMDIVLVTIPPLIMFIFFNRKIVVGNDGRRGEGLTRTARVPPISGGSHLTTCARRTDTESSMTSHATAVRRVHCAAQTDRGAVLGVRQLGDPVQGVRAAGRAAGPVREDRRRGPGAPVHRGRRRRCPCTSRGTGSTTTASWPRTRRIWACGSARSTRTCSRTTTTCSAR